MEVQPDPLAVSCERIKSALLRELGAPDRWRGKVHLWIKPGTSPEAPLRVLSTRFTDGWQHSIQVPDEIDASALLRVVIQALLTEIASRYPGEHAPEIPVWLLEGFTGELGASVGPDMIVKPSALLSKVGQSWGQLEPNSRNQRMTDDIDALQARLRESPPLSFNQLSFPAPQQLMGPGLLGYQASARLFLRGLLRLPGGKQALWSMLSQLTQRLNWQTAFLTAYQGQFRRLLDVEHWWALTLVRFTGRENTSAASREVSLERLSDVLHVRVEVRTSPKSAPRRTSISLQQVIRDWDGARQQQVLRFKLSQLRTLQLEAPADVASLLGEYISVLGGYREQRFRAGPTSGRRGQGTAESQVLLRDTLRRLDELDRKAANASH